LFWTLEALEGSVTRVLGVGAAAVNDCLSGESDRSHTQLPSRDNRGRVFGALSFARIHRKDLSG